MSACLDCDSPYHRRCAVSVLTLPRWERLPEHQRRVEVARRSRPEDVLAAYRVIAHHVATAPEGSDGTATVRLAAHVLRGNA